MNIRKGICVVSLAALMASGCSDKKQEQPKEAKAAAVPVAVAEVRTQNLTRTLDYVGNVRGEEEIFVFPKVSGKVFEKLKNEGEPVKRGEAIIFIDRDETGFKFEKAPVESPIDGTVGRIFVDLGSNVSPQTQIALVVSMRTVTIDLLVPETVLSLVKSGQQAAVSVDAFPEKTFQGIVSAVSPVLDLSTRSAPVEIHIENPGNLLKPGMFARVSLAVEEYTDAVVIPKEAVMGRNSSRHVFTVEGGRAVSRKVELGMAKAGYYQIRSGLEPGDQVVVMGQQNLQEGTEVVIEPLRLNGENT